MQPFLITTSWDDGSIEDLKLAKLLLKYNIPATFYIPIKNPERSRLKDAEIRQLAKFFEIGAHTFNHTPLDALPYSQAKREIIDGKKGLEQTIGREISSLSYPFGNVNQTVRQLVDQAGFQFARTTSLFATSIEDKLLAPTTVHAYNHQPLIYLKEGITKRLFYGLLISGKFSLDWEKLAVVSVAWCMKNGGIFHLWGHSWEIEKFSSWEKLERVFLFISRYTKKEDRITNGEI